MSIARAALLARPRAASTFALQRRPASTDSHAADSHHHDEHHGEHDDIAYPKEGFTSSAWRVGILLSVAVVGWYKLAPAKGEDVAITRWLAETSTPAEYWEKLNLQHLFLAQEAAQTFQIQADAKTPLVHRYRYPQALTRVSPHLAPVGISVDVSEVVPKRDGA
ncbi:hypothetical protein PLICRDRAFT_154752 [Plicaturopsis crispa FD-325 SS-3]|nr:hypothetical protein PLICRDRAFT_154752 [Plicaturopsis crispa FD-325 SS-3]